MIPKAETIMRLTDWIHKDVRIMYGTNSAINNYQRIFYKSPYDRRGLEAFQRDTIPYGLEIRDGRENILPSAVWKQTDLGLNASSVTSHPSDPG